METALVADWGEAVITGASFDTSGTYNVIKVAGAGLTGSNYNVAITFPDGSVQTVSETGANLNTSGGHTALIAVKDVDGDVLQEVRQQSLLRDALSAA